MCLLWGEVCIPSHFLVVAKCLKVIENLATLWKYISGIASTNIYQVYVSAWHFIGNITRSSPFPRKVKKTKAKMQEATLVVESAQLRSAVQAFTLRLRNARTLIHHAVPCWIILSAFTPIPCQDGHKALLPAFLSTLLSILFCSQCPHLLLIASSCLLFPCPDPCMWPSCLCHQLIISARVFPTCK